MSVLSGPKHFLYNLRRKKIPSFSLLDACYFLACKVLETHHKSVEDAFSDPHNHFTSILLQYTLETLLWESGELGRLWAVSDSETGNMSEEKR